MPLAHGIELKGKRISGTATAPQLVDAIAELARLDAEHNRKFGVPGAIGFFVGAALALWGVWRLISKSDATSVILLLVGLVAAVVGGKLMGDKYEESRAQALAALLGKLRLAADQALTVAFDLGSGARATSDSVTIDWCKLHAVIDGTTLDMTAHYSKIVTLGATIQRGAKRYREKTTTIQERLHLRLTRAGGLGVIAARCKAGLSLWDKGAVTEVVGDDSALAITVATALTLDEHRIATALNALFAPLGVAAVDPLPTRATATTR